MVIECPPAENWKLAFAPGDAPARLACAAGASESVKLYALDDADTASEPNAEYKLPVRGDGEGARVCAAPAGRCRGREARRCP